MHGIWSCLCWVPDFGYMGAWKGLKAYKRIIVAWLIIHLNTYYSIMSKYQSVHITVDMTLTLIPKPTEQPLWESLLSKWAQSLKTSTMAVILVAAMPFLTEVISSSRIKVIFQLIKKKAKNNQDSPIRGLAATQEILDKGIRAGGWENEFHVYLGILQPGDCLVEYYCLNPQWLPINT